VLPVTGGFFLRYRSHCTRDVAPGFNGNALGVVAADRTPDSSTRCSAARQQSARRGRNGTGIDTGVLAPSASTWLPSKRLSSGFTATSADQPVGRLLLREPDGKIDLLPQWRIACDWVLRKIRNGSWHSHKTVCVPAVETFAIWMSVSVPPSASTFGRQNGCPSQQCPLVRVHVIPSTAAVTQGPEKPPLLRIALPPFQSAETHPQSFVCLNAIAQRLFSVCRSGAYIPKRKRLVKELRGLKGLCNQAAPHHSLPPRESFELAGVGRHLPIEIVFPARLGA
jgi:hypothetical protein